MHFLYSVVFLSLMACSHGSLKNLNKEGATSLSLDEEFQDDESYLESADIKVEDLHIPKPAHDISIETESSILEMPHEMNAYVQKWLDYFTGRGRRHMNRYLKRSTRYIPKMKEIIRSYGLPEDLVYISLIESGYRPAAESHASAVGYWQFIRGTGKRYGLEMNALIDERRDFIDSTNAASRYMKDLYGMFDSWFLAIASYNVGENRIKRLVKRHNTKDFWYFVKHKKLPRETMDYVPKYLAARMIGKDPEKYGFTDLEYQAPLAFDLVPVSHSVDLQKFATFMGVPFKEIKGLNPSYKAGIAPFDTKDGKLVLRVPKGMYTRALEVSQKSLITKAQITKKVRKEFFYYRVRRGDTVGHIARRFRTSIRKIKSLNGIGRRSKIYVGKSLRIPSSARFLERSKVAKKTSRKRSKARVAKSTNGVHRIRSGDNLTEIAKIYGTTVSSLKRMNGMKRSRLYVGQSLKVPGAKNVNAGDFKLYKVKKGDTLIGIANRFKTTIDQIARLNGITRRARIFYGQKLKVPGM